MRIHMTARHCEFDPEDRLFAEQRLEKLVRFAQDIQEARLILTAEDYRHVAEVTLRLRGRETVAREEADRPRTAISAAMDRLEHQLRKLKDRRLEQSRGDRTRAADAVNPPGEAEGGDEWEGGGMARGEE